MKTSSPLTDTAQRLDRINELYSQGLYLDALGESQPLGPLTNWPGTRGRVLAGRLANNLGGQRLGRAVHLRAFREDPGDWDVRYFYIWARFSRRGPLVAWQKMEAMGDPDDAREVTRADWLALKAHTLAMLRDFEAADAIIDRALEIAPQRPWVWVERSGVLEMEDRLEEAIEAAQRAIELRPFYRPAVQVAAHALVQLNRDDDALTLLEAASEKLQSGDIIAQLSALQSELQMYEAARANADRLAEYYPLSKYDRKRDQWIAARRADAAYFCGDIDEAVRLAKESDSPFHEQLVERMSQSGEDARRRELPVPFVKQHHNTCGPATLSSITQYWRHPVDHLEVVEKICYDGTPAHSERNWAEENGFLAREFTLTWDAGRALLDLGLPFTLTTVEPGNAHLQAAHGYDERRGSMLVRDPGERHTAEFLAEKMIEHYAHCGPRAMVIAPLAWLDGDVNGKPLADPRIGGDGATIDRDDFAARFNAIDLPDADLYDWYHRIESSLQQHDREAARKAHDQMQLLDTGHRLTIHGRRAIAAYDADSPTMLTCAERLLKLFPDDVNLQMMRLQLLAELGRGDERKALLEEACAKIDADPYFWQQMALELSDDARQYDRVYQLVRRSMRYRPLDEGGMSLLADVMWDKPEQRADALTLYRFAACLGERNENRARSYLIASRHLHRTHEALKFLEDRFRRFGHQKSWPAQTLVWAHEVLERSEDAFGVLDEALGLRPDDGELLLFAADMYSRYGRSERARELLALAQDNSHATTWMRTAAGVEMAAGNLQPALDCWKKVLAAEPLARDANQMVAELIGDLEGHDAAIAHVEAALARFPHSYALHSLSLQWQSAIGAEEAEIAARSMLEAFPMDAFARRELAIALSRGRKWDQVEQEIRLADELEPNHPLCAFLRGRGHHAVGRIDQAKAAFRDAIRISVDYDSAMPALIEMCDTQAERETELAFVYEELVRQVTFGEGLLAYREFAGTTWPPEKILGQLREALHERPDLWQAHSALAMQLLDMGETGEALEIASAATNRFPLLPRMWVDLAWVHQARRDAQGEINALEKALEISPFYSDAARQLAEVLLRQTRLDEAHAVIDKAIAGAPREIPNYGTLGDVLWAQGQQDRALEEVTRAVTLEPGYEYGWFQLRHWSAQLGKPELVLDLLRDLTQRRPNEPRSWRLLYDALIETEHREECLAALETAIELNPRDVDSHSAKAYALMDAGKFDEALDACRPEIFGNEPPIELRGRAAEVFIRRGDIDEAIAAMRQVLSDDSNYIWAWRQLTSWFMELGRFDDYFNTADEFVRVAPRLPQAWGYRADAHRMLERRSEALSDYKTAFELDPSYTYAAMSLMDFHIEDGDIGAAEHVLQSATDMPPDYRLGNQVRIDVAHRNLNDTLTHLRELCQSPLSEEEPLRMAAGDMWDANYASEFCGVLHEMWSDENVSPHVATVWAQASGMLGNLRDVAQALDARSADTPQWHAAAQRYLVDVGAGKELAMLRRFIKRQGALIHRDDATWAEAGDALYQCGDRPAAITWLAEWPRRDARPYMLFSLVLAQWESLKIDAALATGAAALNLEPDQTYPLHLLFAAMGHAVSRDVDASGAMLDQVQPDGLPEPYHKLFDATAMLTQLLAMSPSQSSYATAKRQLAGATAGILAAAKEERVDKHLLHLSRAALAEHFGKTLAARWHRWRAKSA